MEILSVRSEKKLVSPGAYALTAEVKIWDEEANDYRYLNYSIFDCMQQFDVTAQSGLDYLNDNNANLEEEIETIEMYESLAEAMGSKYIDGFILAHQIVNEMIDITFGHRKSIYNYIVSPIEFEEADDKEESILEDTLIAKFMYQPSPKAKKVQRKAVVRTADGFVVQCCMYDENDQLVESFEDVDAAAKSKWYLLYQNMAEKMGAQAV